MGIEPAPERDAHPRWSTFLKAHWECLTATDFMSVEVCTIKGLVTQYILFFIDIASRSVHVAGITPHPDNSWMTQIVRNITDVDDGFLRTNRYLILDRDGKYSDGFRNVLVREGIHVVRLPPRSPNLNAFAERFVRSIKEECLNRMIFFGQASLRHTITQYMTHYQDERNHQGLEKKPPPAVAPRRWRTSRPSQTASATRRNAQLLLPRSSLTSLDSVSGHYGVALGVVWNRLLGAG